MPESEPQEVITREITLDALPHQVAFWSDETPDARIALVGPLGTGKTRSLVIKRLLLHTRNSGMNSMIVEPTYPMVRDILVPAIEEILGDELGLPIKINRTDHDLVWPRSMGGGTTHLRSADDPDRLVGTNLSDVGFDEPGRIAHSAYRKGSVRARHPRATVRQVYLAGSPEGMNWFAAEFNDPVPPNKTIRARGWHPSMKHYPGQLRHAFAGDQAQLESYLDGKFVPLFQGRCYGPFDRARHVSANGALGYNPHLELVLACDFNIDAMRWEVGQVHPGQIQILDEIALGQNGPVQDAAAEFIRRYHPQLGAEQRHAGIVRVTGDASGKGRTHTGEVAYNVLMDALVKVGWRGVTLDVPPANPMQRDRVDTVNFHLAGSGKTVLIHPRCKELILDLEQNVWKQGTAEIAKSNSGVEALRTHAADAFGYMVWALCQVGSDAPRVTIPQARAVRRADPIMDMVS